MVVFDLCLGIMMLVVGGYEFGKGFQEGKKTSFSFIGLCEVVMGICFIIGAIGHTVESCG